ncbi:hypothetical protein CANARDRAFT_23815 [[Candida] arabinofermentans NRRL YB-2248]|uniref:NADH dehydrogenase [ubiquinone] 1 alpha subcomplex assembly factor 3 n=1 Tax=[Candida] arabinofermentans NRRL YB-2248 TaxID=983967 RepID=A0A1E4SZ82_9ASCO|nr:hypothetical protein CANARDRAFT_23815 [[Candida] arabinofermentans NRRL YB-2248]
MLRCGIRCFSVYSSALRHGPTNFKPADIGKNLSNFDVLSVSAIPGNNIEMISSDSIVFSNMKVIKSPNVQDGKPTGCLLIDDQILELNLSDLIITNDLIVDFSNTCVFKLLNVLYPKPELIVIGLGKKSRLLSTSSRESFNKLGIKLEISDTKNSVLNFDLLATERGSNLIGGIILPPNL